MEDSRSESSIAPFLLGKSEITIVLSVMIVVCLNDFQISLTMGEE
jgi:hypothetical protein